MIILEAIFLEAIFVLTWGALIVAIIRHPRHVDSFEAQMAEFKKRRDSIADSEHEAKVSDLTSRLATSDIIFGQNITAVADDQRAIPETLQDEIPVALAPACEPVKERLRRKVDRRHARAEKRRLREQEMLEDAWREGDLSRRARMAQEEVA